MKKECKKVLFSCAGTSDPIRGEHDGPLLHIMRYYRPDAVFVVLTPEVDALNAADSRYEKIRQYIFDKWNGYSPEITTIICNELNDASDIDQLDDALQDAFNMCIKNYPDYKILINISSGTPQMKTVMSHFATDSRYDTTAIQVKNYEHASGTSQRTNQHDYDIDIEIELNEDDLPDAENRCSEPELFAVRRRAAVEQIRTLLDKREFSALSDLKGFIPEELYQVIDHLSQRSQLNWTAASNLAKNINIGFELYPDNNKTVSDPHQNEYWETVEYALIMKNLQCTGKLTEFILHMDPIVRRLQTLLLDDMMRTTFNISFASVTKDYGRKYSPEDIQQYAGPLYSYLESKDIELEARDVSTLVNTLMLSYFPNVPKNAKELFDIYEKLKNERNNLAHEMKIINEDEVRNACGKTSREIEKTIEKSIVEIFPRCNPAIFNVYDKCIAYIKDNL